LGAADALALAPAHDLAGRLGRRELGIARGRPIVDLGVDRGRIELRGIRVVVPRMAEPPIAALVGDVPRPAAVARPAALARLVAGSLLGLSRTRRWLRFRLRLRWLRLLRHRWLLPPRWEQAPCLPPPHEELSQLLHP